MLTPDESHKGPSSGLYSRSGTDVGVVREGLSACASQNEGHASFFAAMALACSCEDRTEAQNWITVAKAAIQGAEPPDIRYPTRHASYLDTIRCRVAKPPSNWTSRGPQERRWMEKDFDCGMCRASRMVLVSHKAEGDGTSYRYESWVWFCPECGYETCREYDD